MGFTIKNKGKQQDPVPAEAHVGICYMLVDLGTQVNTKYDKIARKVVDAMVAAARKHDVDPDQLAGLHRRLRLQLDEIEHADGALAATAEAERVARAAYDAAAARLTEKKTDGTRSRSARSTSAAAARRTRRWICART